jgi:hypothetical protein
VNKRASVWIALGLIASAAIADPARNYIGGNTDRGLRGVRSDPFPTGAVADPARAYFSNDPSRGLRGIHIDRLSSDHIPHGISLDLDGEPVWGTAAIDFEMPDLVLAYSYVTQSDQFRMRPDTGQIDLGPIVGHPVTQNQLNVTAGTPDDPLDGVGVGVYGNRAGIYLYQKLPGSLRTKITFNNLFQVGTDCKQVNSPDFSVFNNRTGRVSLGITPSDEVVMGYGATIGRTLAHTGSAVGFYGAPPVTRPTITGSRSDGTALANLLSKLQAMGLIVDNTTP